MNINFIRIAKISLAGTFVLLTAGCITADKRHIFADSPIALAAIIVNNEINWKGEEPSNPNMISRSVRRTMEENPDMGFRTTADVFMDDIESVIKSTLEVSPSITFASREKILNSRAYREARVNSYHEKDAKASPAGFRFINNRDKRYPADSYAETGIKKYLYITLELTKEMASGFGKNGSCRVITEMNMVLKDETGKTLYSKSYDVYSRDVINVSNGIYSQQDLRRIILSSIQDVCYYFVDQIAY